MLPLAKSLPSAVPKPAMALESAWRGWASNCELLQVDLLAAADLCSLSHRLQQLRSRRRLNRGSTQYDSHTLDNVMLTNLPLDFAHRPTSRSV
jgi:hypothetical protein